MPILKLSLAGIVKKAKIKFNILMVFREDTADPTYFFS